MWEDLLCHAEESGLHPVGDWELLKDFEQKHGTISFVGKNYLPGSFPISSLEGWIERDCKANWSRRVCSDGSGERQVSGNWREKVVGFSVSLQRALRIGRISSCLIT